jgi:hypothetical protein
MACGGFLLSQTGYLDPLYCVLIENWEDQGSVAADERDSALVGRSDRAVRPCEVA